MLVWLHQGAGWSFVWSSFHKLIYNFIWPRLDNFWAFCLSSAEHAWALHDQEAKAPEMLRIAC
jgi:hypothetical protein